MIQFFILILLGVVGIITGLFTWLYFREGRDGAAAICGVIAVICCMGVWDIVTPLIGAIGAL